MASHEPESPETPSLGSPPKEPPLDHRSEATSSFQVEPSENSSNQSLPLEGAGLSSDESKKNDQFWHDFLGRRGGELYKRYGRYGVALVVVFGIWWNWSTIYTLPGVSSLLDLARPILEKPLPPHDPQLFSIAIAHLQNDQDEEIERMLVETIQEFEGIQVAQFDRMILSGKVSSAETIRGGHHQALKYLDMSGFDAVIWGTVLKNGTRAVPKLYWTANLFRDYVGAGKRYAPTQELSLPSVFWEDLVEVLKLILVAEGLKFNSLTGHYIADQIQPFIVKVHQILDRSINNPGWSNEARTEVKTILALAYWITGDQVNQNSYLKSSIHLWREVLQVWTQAQRPLDWAMAQNNLGSALARLGEREENTALLEEAVVAYHAVLEEQTRARSPLKWARIQVNLGNALASIGNMEERTDRLEEAVVAYRGALEELTQARVPLQWAWAQNGLGVALKYLGQQEGGRDRLEEAVLAYRAALKVWTQARVPLDWARTQSNLGNALNTLGKRETGTARFEEAAVANRAALQELTQANSPLDWARTQNNLGVSLEALGEEEEGTAQLEEAVLAYRAALKVRTQARMPLDWALTQNNLGNALTRLGAREESTARLEEAVVAFRAALEERTQARVPLDWAKTQYNLGAALARIGREGEVGTAKTQYNLGAALARIGKREGEVGTARLPRRRCLLIVRRWKN